MAQVKKNEVRERILAAAAELFAERGYGQATVAQIAKAAGTAPSNVYVYFKSKLGIAFAIYEPWLEEHLDAMAKEVARLKTPEAKVFRLVQVLWHDIPTDRNAFANNLIQAISAATPEDGYEPALLRATEQKIATALSQALPPARAAEIDCMSFAHILMMAFDGFAVNRSNDTAIYCDDAMVEQMSAAILGHPPRKAVSARRASRGPRRSA